MKIIDKLMGIPQLYAAVQNTIAATAHKEVKATLSREILDEIGIEILDVGCGIGDYSVLYNHASYTGMDLDENYIRSATTNYGRSKVTFIVGNATIIPFPAGCFDYCFSVGLYHHLPDDAVVASLHEALRVAGPGKVIVIDAIYPSHGNYLGYLLRRLDRGKFVRSFTDYEKLLREKFSVYEISARRAGLLDYIYYRL